MPTDIPQPPQLPDENREGNRQWLNILLDRHFNGNVSAMANAFGLDSAGRKRLERVLRGQTKTVPGDLVKKAHRYVHDHRDLSFAPAVDTGIPYTRHPAVARNGEEDRSPISLPYVTYSVEHDPSSGYRVVGTVEDDYFVDPSVLANEAHDPPRTKAVTPMIGDAMAPEIRTGDRLILELSSEGESPIPRDGLYLFRLEDALHVRRVNRLPNRQIECRDGSGTVTFTLALQDGPDLEIIGRVWSYPRRL